MSHPFTPRFPDTIDSTMLVEWRACPRKFFHSFCLNMAVSTISPDLHFGGALARGMQAARETYFRDGLSAKDAVEASVVAATAFYGDYNPPEKKKNKAWDRLLAALLGYWERWPIDKDPIRAHQGIIEFSFAVPIPGTRHPITGDPILYTGRYDMLGERDMGLSKDEMLIILDEKTQGSGFTYNWADKWELRNQFMGYTWASKQLGYPVSRVEVRGISVLITKVDFMPAFASYPDYLLERWLYQVQLDLNKMTHQWESGFFDFNFGNACSEFGGCQFQDVCVAENPADWYSMFKQRNWDPIKQDPTREAA